jgi:DNA replication protein DnaC
MLSETDITRLQSEYVGRRFAGASLAGVALGSRGNDVKNWLNKKKNMLIFLGAPGIGKTYFCSALLPWICGKVSSFRYWNERVLLSRIRATMGQEKGDYLKELDYLLDDEFVILDDLGSSGVTDWRKEVLFDAIDRRYESERPTVITSNFTRQQIFDSFGGRIHSRMFSRENLILELHNAPDLRQAEPKKEDA